MIKKLPDWLVLHPGQGVSINGVMLPVSVANFSMAELITERVLFDEGGPLLYKDKNGDTKMRKVTLPMDQWRQMPEAYHVNVICGENGWYLELAIYPDQPFYDFSCAYTVPGEETPEDWGHLNHSPEEILAKYRELCARTYPVPVDPDDENDFTDDPSGGMRMGWWDAEFYIIDPDVEL